MFKPEGKLSVLNMIKTVLLIEDDRMVSMLIKSYLEKGGYVVHQCFRGDTAHEDLGKFQSDMVILDIGLPGADGFHVCHQIREIYSGPIIVLTARDKDKEQVTASILVLMIIL